MRHFFLTISLFLVCISCAFAQSAQRADALFGEGKYQEALVIYQALHRKEASNPLYTYRLARCEQEMGNPEAAISYFQVENTKRYTLRNFFLAEAYFQAYQFAQAKELYNAYLENIGSEEERYQYTQLQLIRTDRLERYFRKMEDIFIIDSVSINADSLCQHIASMTDEIGTFSCQDGLYSYTNQRGDRRYITVKTDDGRTILCKQEKLLDEWTEPDTLPLLINQNARQNYPFLMPDGMTLYYAAESENGLGGWDIYVTRFNPSTNSYIKPELLNMPFNSINDDLLLWVNENEGKGYFLSNRRGHLCLYSFIPSTQKKTLDADDSYKSDFARLKCLRPLVAQETEENTHIEPVFTKTEEPDEPDFTLVINDSIVYHALSDFRSDEARQMAETYLDLLDQIKEETEELATKRLSYQTAESADLKMQLSPLILSLEKDVLRLKKEAKQTLLILRQKESKQVVSEP